jgi:hypothetical protein
MTDATAGEPQGGDASTSDAPNTGNSASTEAEHDEIEQLEKGELTLQKEAQQSRLTQWIAVIAASIAALSAFGSALVAAHTAVYTARSQAHAAAVLSQRQERRDAYAKFATDVVELNVKETLIADWFTDYFSGQPKLKGPVQWLQQTSDDYVNDMDAFDQQVDIVSLVSSPAVDAAALKIRDKQLKLAGLVQVFVLAARANDIASTHPRLAEFNASITDIENDLKNFKQTAKADLDSLGYGDSN